MKFEEILPLMRDGGKAIRSGIKTVAYIYLEDRKEIGSGLMFQDDSNPQQVVRGPYQISSNDLMAEDWEYLGQWRPKVRQRQRSVQPVAKKEETVVRVRTRQPSLSHIEAPARTRVRPSRD